jgi:mycothiol synthase
MLYVGVENKAALNLYKSLGFGDFGSDVMYRAKN